MQHFTIRAILLPLLLLLGTVYATAQVRAITSDGDEVILYPNGTWEYLSSRPVPNPHPGASATIGAGASGKRVGILLNRQLLFVLREGQLEDLFIYNTRGQLVYSYREGIYQIPYGWRVEYEPLSDRVRQFGPYQFRYQLLSERLEQVGTCKIDYELLSERVRRIGDYSIRYDLLSNLITEIGNIRIEYDPFTERIRGVSGTAPGVEIQFLRDGGGRPRPFL
ncbi:hypothetical protein [Porphyromonas uenonis]|uniref:hypothetical protein n=1 Tax=Porphyromonas uenonis TaxID=281920 RepID=UPI00267262BE|nr:hypothetical protein [Porphyromonas uenonis]